jgi:hypothetical protein
LLLEILDLFGVYDPRVAIVKRLAKTDLFGNRIQTHGERGEIHFTTFVTTPPMSELLDDQDGPIMRYCASKKFRRLYKEIREKKFEDLCFKIIKEYFSMVRGLNRHQWDSPGRYVLATDRGVRAFLRLLIEILEYSKKWDKALVKQILKCLKTFDFRNNNLKGKYLGEAGADEFANDLIMKIKQVKVDFGPQSKQISKLSVEYNHIKEAENYIEKQFKSFEGVVRGELPFIDESTIEYLKFIPQACGIKIITDGAKPDERTIRHKIRNEMKDWRYVRFKKITAFNDSGQEIHPNHGRWISDEKCRINLEVDLKKDALKKRHTKYIYDNPNLSKEVQDFEKIWDSSLNELENIFGISNIEIKSIT